jgi:Tfp pilus assembly protein PilN
MRWVEVNLVDWREAARKQALVRWALASFCTASTVLAVALWQSKELKHRLDGVQSHIDVLDSRIAALQSQQEGLKELEQEWQKLMTFERYTAKLIERRLWWTQFMHALPQWIVSDVYLQRLDYHFPKVSGQGIALSSQGLTALLSRLTTSSQVSSVRLDNVTHDVHWLGLTGSRFQIHFDSVPILSTASSMSLYSD